MTRVAFLAPILFFVSCAGFSKSRGHREVSTLLHDRTGLTTGWKEGEPTGDSISKTVDGYLSQPLTQPHAIHIALLNNPELQSIYAELDIAQADLIQAGLLSNPRIGAHISIPLPGFGSVVEPEFSLVQNFLDLFMLPLRKKIAADRFAAEISRVTHEVLRVVAETKKEFVSFQALQKRVELQKQKVETASASALLAQLQRNAGNITALDLATEQSNETQARIELVKEERALVTQAEKLNRRLGLLTAPTRWNIPLALAELPEHEPPFEALESLAISQRLDIDALRKTVDLYSRATSLAKNSRLTGIFEIGINFKKDSHMTLGPSLSIELPIFDQRQGTIARLEALVKQTERQLKMAEVNARSEVRLAVASVKLARNEVVYFRTLLPLRGQVLQQSMLMYNAMQVGLYTVLDAKNKENDAALNGVDALANYWSAYAELERSVGGSLKNDR